MTQDDSEAFQAQLNESPWILPHSPFSGYLSSSSGCCLPGSTEQNKFKNTKTDFHSTFLEK